MCVCVYRDPNDIKLGRVFLHTHHSIWPIHSYTTKRIRFFFLLFPRLTKHTNIKADAAAFLFTEILKNHDFLKLVSFFCSYFFLACVTQDASYKLFRLGGLN